MYSRCHDRLRWAAALLPAVLLVAGCYREQRQFDAPRDTLAESALSTLRLSDIQPGRPLATPPVANRYEENAYAVSQGKKWFSAFNCNGCHAQGGGGSGPALMDDKWIYGAEPTQIYATISQGRPNGMPSFGGHIPADQMWQLVAYVRSMSGHLRSDVAPSRSDRLQASEPEQRREPQPPKPANSPSS